MKTLPQEELHRLFEYKDGKLYSRVDRGDNGKIRVGSLIGSKDKGYLVAKINDKSYQVHRMIYMMHHGWVPPMLDHINMDRADNRIENLRPATQIQNQYNCKVRRDSSSKVKGVGWHAQAKKWQARCKVNKVYHSLGLYASLEQAEQVVKEFRERHHGEYCNHG